MWLPIAARTETQCLSCSAAQQHSTFTVQILYKLYSLQLNCTHSNYTEAAATCSGEQQHSTFIVQILYKLYSLQQNCTYSNYTDASATCSAAQQHTNCPAYISSEAECCRLLDNVCLYTDRNHIWRLDLSNKSRSLQSYRHSFAALLNTLLHSSHATAGRLL